MTNRSLLERLRSWLPLIPPLLLLAGTYWLNRQVQPILPKPDSSKRHDIDFSVHDLSSLTLDQQGQPRYLLATEKMWHYPDDDATHMQAPHLVSLQRDRAPIIISSQTGTVSSHGDEAFFSDDVKVLRLGDGASDAIKFNTEFLHVVPGKDQADTDRPVTLVTSHDVIHGVGMKLDTKLRTITLLSNVTATHEPVKK
jgi:lipopolysaccharide export system protein LptC